MGQTVIHTGSSFNRMDSGRVQISRPVHSPTLKKTLLNTYCVPGLCLTRDTDMSKFSSNPSLGDNKLDSQQS